MPLSADIPAPVKTAIRFFTDLVMVVKIKKALQ
jgi:hypothetical protein